MRIPPPDFAHLRDMSNHHGTFEHARFALPRPEHGYCTDDMARLLVVTTREPGEHVLAGDLARLSLRFLITAQGTGGGFRNRMHRHGHWEDLPAVEDAWGRSIWGLGSAAAHSPDDALGRSAVAHFERAARLRSVWPRAMAFAALGAAELLSVRPDHAPARALLRDAAAAMPAPVDDRAWPWPERRLSYANALLPEAMLAAGHVLGRPTLVQQGLDLLGWLLEHETVGDHLSVTPVGGAAMGDVRPGFDQQPIEVAALADACARAITVDGSRCWVEGATAAVGWFLGDNDAGLPMWDPLTGGGFDGLESDGVNANQGTESTLALLSTLQHARRLTPVLV
jgi:hypothetical protein